MHHLAGGDHRVAAVRFYRRLWSLEGNLSYNHRRDCAWIENRLIDDIHDRSKSRGDGDLSALFLRDSDCLRQLFPSEPPNAVVQSEARGAGKGALCAA